ncbi:MAG: hypothetical protein JWP12_1593 [Bacteroidetes bacterium]|nr:hypothetical protein [Bacteroidota bacterium]
MDGKYDQTHIKWVKNVKRDNGNSWAYENQEVGSIFPLNWSEHYGINVSLPRVDDIILLFQTVNSNLGIQKGTYLTHLVTPVDNDVYIDENATNYPNTRLVRVLGKESPGILSSRINLNFSKVSRGLCFKVDLIVTRKGFAKINKERKQSIIWQSFDNIITSKLNLVDADDNYGVLEGAQKKEMREHRYYERDMSIITLAKNQATTLKCESCDFNFEVYYPGVGQGFIECHHKTPIGKGVERWTRVSDLALVCANCHRMLHRKHEGRYLSVEELKGLINKRKV